MTGSITSQTTRGFTGEEELSVGSLVHLNGRVYDALLARFTSADPTITDPMNMQGWNRYSYVGNDPLAFTDPNGFSWLSSFFRSVTNFFRNNSIIRSIVQIAIAVAVTVASGGNVVLGAQVSAFIVTGLSGGNLGQMLKASWIAGATAFAFSGLPVAFGANFNPIAYAENVAGSALIGCASSAASGGSCGSGAAAAAVSAGLAPATGALFPNAANDIGQRVGGTIVQATAGGLASVAGGGKFANGAVTGAFAYLAAFGPVSGNNDRRMNANAQMSEDEETRGRGLIPETPEEIRREIEEEQNPNIRGGLDYTPRPAPNPNVCTVEDSLDIGFKTFHAANHLEGTGLTAAEVEGAIRSEINSQSGASTRFSGPFSGTVSVQGQSWEYRAFGLPNGKINVGTYFPVNR